MCLGVVAVVGVSTFELGCVHARRSGTGTPACGRSREGNASGEGALARPPTPPPPVPPLGGTHLSSSSSYGLPKMSFICLKMVLFPDSPAPSSSSLIFSSSFFIWFCWTLSICLFFWSSSVPVDPQRPMAASWGGGGGGGGGVCVCVGRPAQTALPAPCCLTRARAHTSAGLPLLITRHLVRVAPRCVVVRCVAPGLPRASLPARRATALLSQQPRTCAPRRLCVGAPAVAVAVARCCCCCCSACASTARSRQVQPVESSRVESSPVESRLSRDESSRDEDEDEDEDQDAACARSCCGAAVARRGEW